MSIADLPIEPGAPLFLVLARATVWAGSLLSVGDQEIPIAAGFTAITYTRLETTMPADLLERFADAGAVSAIFAFDNTLTSERGGYRTFRTTGPAFLNDLESIGAYGVFFVLAERATSLSIPEG